MPGPPAAATAVFGARLGLAVRYADLLATAGVERGLIGPREVARLWDRHLLNCAFVGELIPLDARVIDVGSGAGLPGIVLALARPDLTITLLEPNERRATFLLETIEELGLAAVDVRRARAEESHGSIGTRAGGQAEIVTARAVAPLDRLVPWCLPLVRTGGSLLAIKGQSAQAELDRCGAAVRLAGGTLARVRLCGGDFGAAPTTVVEIVRGSERAATRRRAR